MFTIGQHVKTITDGPYIRGTVIDYATTAGGKKIVLIQAHESSSRHEWWPAEKVELVPDPSFREITTSLFDAMVSHYEDHNDFINGFSPVLVRVPAYIDGTPKKSRMWIAFGGRTVEVDITEVLK